jgi:hypothetical protein
VLTDLYISEQMGQMELPLLTEAGQLQQEAHCVVSLIQTHQTLDRPHRIQALTETERGFRIHTQKRRDGVHTDDNSQTGTHTHLQYAFLVHSDKVEGLVDEVVAQRLEQDLHEGHREAVHPRPAGSILGLTGETLIRKRN